MALTLKEISQKIAQNPKLVIVEDFEIGVEETSIDTVSTHSNKTKNTKIQKEFLITLRLLHRKRLGEGFATATDSDSLNLLVENAIASAESSLPCPWFRFPLWRSVAKEGVQARTSPLNRDEIVVPEGVYVVVSNETKNKRIQRKTEKQVLEQSVSNQYVEVMVSVPVKHTEVLLKEKIKNPTSTDTIHGTIKKLLNEKKYFSNAPTFPILLTTGLVFSESVGAGILERLSQLFAADSPVAESYWNTQKRALSDKVAIIDDGKMSFSTGEFFDFEGVAGQKVILVSDGKVQSLLHNTTTGAKYNRPGTGSLRSFENSKGPRISHSNLYMEKGSKKIEDIIHHTVDGIFVEAATNWEMFERDGIDFVQFDALGWRIENGEGKFPVFCERISFPLAKYLECIVDVSDKIEWHGNVASPAVTVHNLLT